MIDKSDFLLHFNEFKEYIKNADPITILKDVEFQKFFKTFVDRQSKRHVDKFKYFIEYLLNNSYRGWVYIMVNDRIAHKISFRTGILSDTDMFFIDVCQNNEYEVVNTYELCSYPSQPVYEIRWKCEDGTD